jgi:hypothetical protein
VGSCAPAEPSSAELELSAVTPFEGVPGDRLPLPHALPIGLRLEIRARDHRLEPTGLFLVAEQALVDELMLYRVAALCGDAVVRCGLGVQL